MSTILAIATVLFYFASIVTSDHPNISTDLLLLGSISFTSCGLMFIYTNRALYMWLYIGLASLLGILVILFLSNLILAKLDKR